MSLRALLAALLTAGVAGAYAAPPWNVDDPGTTPGGHAIFYVSYADAQSHFERTETAPGLSVTLGLTDRTEFGIGFAALAASNPGASSGYGLGDVAAGLKHRLGSWRGTDFAVAYQATFPTGDSGANRGSGSFDQLAWVTGSRPVGRWTLAGNVGAGLGRGHSEDVGFYGLVLSHPGPRATTYGFQVFGSGADTPSGADLSIGTGGTVAIGERGQFQIGLGRSLRGNGDLRVYLGATVEFGPRPSGQPSKPSGTGSPAKGTGAGG